MSKPRENQAPTLQNIAIELTHAMSALNMPDPEHCPSDMVKHAYEHLEAAIKLVLEASDRGVLSPFLLDPELE